MAGLFLNGEIVTGGSSRVVDIKLKDGQSGYEVIGEYFRRYWDNNHIKEVGKCR